MKPFINIYFMKDCPKYFKKEKKTVNRLSFVKSFLKIFFFKKK